MDPDVAESLAGLRLFERTPAGYVGVWINGRREYLHRLILCAPPGMVVDHINFNMLDNRRRNLRLTVQSDNALGRRKRRRPSSSIYLGVSELRPNRWRAEIKARGKRVNIGVFPREIAAALARDRVARLVHGDFAHLNFPDDPAL